MEKGPLTYIDIVDVVNRADANPLKDRNTRRKSLVTRFGKAGTIRLKEYTICT
jgi:hypothetical protein